MFNKKIKQNGNSVNYDVVFLQAPHNNAVDKELGATKIPNYLPIKHEPIGSIRK